MDNAFNIAIG